MSQNLILLRNGVDINKVSYTVILEGPLWPHRAILAFQNRGRFGSNRGQNRALGAKTEH